MRAMVLAAGLGKRLRPLTFEIPKPLAPVANRPVMEHILAHLSEHGFEEVIANLSHLSEQIRERFEDGSRLGLELSYPGGAGGVVEGDESHSPTLSHAGSTVAVIVPPCRPRLHSPS